MGIIWDELTVIFMCLVAKQKYRLETGCSELHNTVFFANGGLNVHNLNRWTWALLIPTKDSEAQKLWFSEIQAQIATLLKPTDINKQMNQNSNGKNQTFMQIMPIWFENRSLDVSHIGNEIDSLTARNH